MRPGRSRSRCSESVARERNRGSAVVLKSMAFRGMEPGPGGLPLVGRSTRRLGVRVPGDISPDAGGDVRPGDGGMSVALGSMWNLPHHRRPIGMLRGSSGPANDRVFAIDEAAVRRQRLDVQPDPPGSPRPAVVEPSMQMSLATYESSLANTRASWQQVWP